MNNDFKCLLIGYGSIGKRHKRILEEQGCEVSILTKQKLDYPNVYNSFKKAILTVDFDLVIIANETHKHLDTLLALKDEKFSGSILIEKPLFTNFVEKPDLSLNVFVAYNLRYHPILQRLKRELMSAKVLSVQCYVGQYLPTWRPSVDYTKSYSSHIEQGGGVLRDLSHELDYLQFLFGEWKSFVAHGGKYSELEINSDDHFTFIMETERVPLINLQLNYLDHITQRFLIINTDMKTYKADLIANTLQINNEVITYDVSSDETYRLQDLAVLNKEYKNLCSYKNGLEIMKIIDKAEQSSKEKRWMYNE